MTTRRRRKTYLPPVPRDLPTTNPDLWAKHGFTDGQEGGGKPPPAPKPEGPKNPPNLPKELIAFPNADKSWHEKWTEGRDLLNLPHPVP